jgi:hypothetical protein
MNILAAVVLAAVIAFALTHKTPRPERHHIYYCQDPISTLWLPCMYRRNDGVNV